jgi:hypothetical protein
MNVREISVRPAITIPRGTFHEKLSPDYASLCNYYHEQRVFQETIDCVRYIRSTGFGYMEWINYRLVLWMIFELAKTTKKDKGAGVILHGFPYRRHYHNLYFRNIH